MMIQPSISETSNDDLHSILKELSVKSVLEEDHDFNEVQVKEQWIGKAQGATNEEVEKS